MRFRPRTGMDGVDGTDVLLLGCCAAVGWALEHYGFPTAATWWAFWVSWVLCGVLIQAVER